MVPQCLFLTSFLVTLALVLIVPFTCSASAIKTVAPKWPQTKPEERLEENCMAGHCPSPLSHAFMTFQQIEWYLRSLNDSLSPRVELSSIGETAEGRNLWMVRIKPLPSQAGAGLAETQAAVWIEGGIHAREWISPMTSLHLLDKIARSCELNCDINYYFVPMLNPDGYEYSRTKDRMWRKNRSVNPGSTCKGVDLNRNWAFKFGVGASSNPCSETFMGSKPFSERETVAASREMSKVNNLKVVLALHSFGEKVYYPWGWTNKPVDNKDNLVKAGNAFAKAVVELGGNNFEVTNSGKLYFASGATDDWSKKLLNVPYVYTLELTGNNFIIPASDIKSSATQVTAGVMALLNETRQFPKGTTII